MKTYDEFYINKTANAFDETLIMFGVARIVSDLLVRQGDGNVTIHDTGASYYLELSEPLLRETVERNAEYLQPAHAIIAEGVEVADGVLTRDYDNHRAIADEYFATRKTEIESKPPEPIYDLLRAIKDFNKFNVLSSHNALIEQWYIMGRHPETLRIILDMFASRINDVIHATDQWVALSKANDWGYHTKAKYESTALQIYNPASGKGQNRSKSDGSVSPTNISSFWLLEYLKVVGFYDAVLTKQFRFNGDIKTYVLAPKKLTYQHHTKLMADFRESMQYADSSVKLDLYATIRYLKVVLNNALEDDDFLAELFELAETKQTIISGFYTAYYKNMGNAVATMNMSFIALLGWVAVETQDDVAIYRAVLDELESVVRQFDESRSEDATLLQHLRDFVSGDDLSAFFRFTTAFTGYYTGKRERNQYAYQLTTDLIERIVMSTEEKLSPILRNEGFQNIAYAIRQATVTAQYRKKQKDTKYEVRYALGQELARKARYPQDFIVALSDFLHKYNAENARVMEIRPQPYRRSIQTSDIDEIVKLIDDYDSETVANLLIAYGHARIPRDDVFNEETTEQENNK